jgi:hypothetical protein
MSMRSDTRGRRRKRWLGLRDALCLLALPYSSHRDFREEWKHDADHPNFDDG